MDGLTMHRWHFAFTITYHYIFPQLTMGLALLIVLPNGLVKLINALPFICGDLRTQTIEQVWANFQRAWSDPRVVDFVDDLARDPGRTRTLHQWVHL